MDPFKGLCPHQSVPVEMDERMTPTNLDLAWPPPCKQCSGQAEPSGRPEEHGCEPPQEALHSGYQCRLPEIQYHGEPRAAYHAAPEACAMPPAGPPSGHRKRPHPADVWPRALGELYDRDLLAQHSRGFAGPSSWSWGPFGEEAESVERPLPLVSDGYYAPSRYPPRHLPGPGPMQGRPLGQCACCPPANLPRQNNNYSHDYQARPHQDPQRHHPLSPPQSRLQHRDAPHGPQGPGAQYEAPPRDVLHEVSVGRTFPAGPGPVTGEVRRTVSLPEECRNIFVTYSADTAKHMIPFAKFLIDQGFKLSIDIFDGPVRSMGITKWMDRFLNDKSVLIIVVISPKYKEDVEGDGNDEHGLHTKYIHNQIQNEFIQQGCLNFRLVPVLFPSATKRHVPSWLQNTRIFRWPHDTQALLLRLLREEHYILPQRGANLTLTVRPVS